MNDEKMRERGPAGATVGVTDSITDILAYTGIRFDADLTEDVDFTYILLDERVWGGSSSLVTGAYWLTLKNFLDMPVKIEIGLKPIMLGSKLICGDFNGPTNQFAS